MSTNSLIAQAVGNNEFRVVYCHWDGYLEHNGTILQNNYDREKLSQLMDLGDMSVLGKDIESSEFYARDRGEDFEDVKARVFDGKNAYNEVLEYCRDEYMYMQDIDGIWWYSYPCDKHPERLDAELETLLNDLLNDELEEA